MPSTHSTNTYVTNNTTSATSSVLTVYTYNTSNNYLVCASGHILTDTLTANSEYYIYASIFRDTNEISNSTSSTTKINLTCNSDDDIDANNLDTVNWQWSFIPHTNMIASLTFSMQSFDLNAPSNNSGIHYYAIRINTNIGTLNIRNITLNAVDLS